jgi:hypothetical protein
MTWVNEWRNLKDDVSQNVLIALGAGGILLK